MKRFHVHVSVDDLEKSLRFYSTLFGVDPSVRKSDYAKWMLEDRRINFAISARGAAHGVDHLGFQVDSGEELEAIHAQLAAADSALVAEKGATCCYARSDKYWVTDPSGVAWETFHTLSSAPVYGSDSAKGLSACCTADEAGDKRAACCAPGEGRDANAACCG